MKKILARIFNAMFGIPEPKPMATEKKLGPQFSIALARNERRQSTREADDPGVVAAKRRHDEPRRRMGINDDSHSSFSSQETETA